MGRFHDSNYIPGKVRPHEMPLQDAVFAADSELDHDMISFMEFARLVHPCKSYPLAFVQRLVEARERRFDSGYRIKHGREASAE